VVLLGRAIPLNDPRAALKSGIALVTEDRRRFGLLLEESVGFNLSLSSLGEFARAGIIRGREEAAINMHWFETMGIKASGLRAVVGRARASTPRDKMALTDRATTP
jgi:ABC-type sugar transport system ATPase subunit